MIELTSTYYPAAAERFNHDTREHVMSVLHDDGLYRHLRFAKPGTGIYAFEVVTWPGCLAYRGDMGNSWVFMREVDMVPWFRSGPDINPGYWLQKVQDGRERAKEYDEAVLARHLRDAAADLDDEPRVVTVMSPLLNDPDTPAPPQVPGGGSERDKFLARVERIKADCYIDLSHQDGARELLTELENERLLSETWEWDLTDFSLHYLWACCAIRAGVEMYAAHSAAKEPARV